MTAAGVSHYTLDHPVFPTRGLFREANLEVAAPGSEYEYYKFSFGNTVYLPLTESLTAKASLDLGFGGGYGDSNEELISAAGNTTYRDGLPFFKHYRGGLVRGYKSNTRGPIDSNGKRIGGDKQLLVGAGLLFPPFGGEGGNDKRFGLFVDGGMVFGQGKTSDGKKFPESIDLSELRYSAGLQFYWNAPIGQAICLFYAEPLNDKTGDKTKSFDILIGPGCNKL